jgi:DNA transposition AAA+ family ATPase
MDANTQDHGTKESPMPENCSLSEVGDATEAHDYASTDSARIERAIRKYGDEFQADLGWYARYSFDVRKLSTADLCEELGMDENTATSVMLGTYTVNGKLCKPPAKMMSRIRQIRLAETNRPHSQQGRIMTPTVAEIWQVCRKVWSDKLLGMIFGDSQLGKTEALKWFRDENNNGATIYVDLQGLNGTQEIYREFARALAISPNTPITKLKPRVLECIDSSNLVIVDEFHYVTYAYQHGSAARMVSEIKSIKDRCRCGMVICSTKVGRDEFEHGREAKLMEQLWRRGTIKLQLPPAVTVADARAICAAYGLTIPDIGKPDTWKQLRVRYPDEDHIRVLEYIAFKQGIQVLITTLKDAQTLARKKDRELR